MLGFILHTIAMKGVLVKHLYTSRSNIGLKPLKQEEQRHANSEQESCSDGSRLQPSGERVDVWSPRDAPAGLSDQQLHSERVVFLEPES